MKRNTRYGLVGTGGRAIMFVDALTNRFRDQASLVGFCDISQTRMDWHNARIKEQYGYPQVPTYSASDFDKMIAETRPDVVVVCTVDSEHHHYICRAMEFGCDVITEKPMTTDTEKMRQIFEVVERTGRSLRVTFNFRYNPAASKVRELISRGVIGKPLAVDLCWRLDTNHGPDYFRRWHREKEKSGGLLVHKSTHHFDIINWWVDSYPQQVFSMGDLKFYGRKNAAERGETYSYERYTGSVEAANDPYALKLDEGSGDDMLYSRETLKGLYLNAEKDSGYVRDRNVFGDDISIEDTMAVMVRYRNGVILNYSLVAYSPWEGYCARITGDKGSIELNQKYGGSLPADQNGKILPVEPEAELKVFPMFGKSYSVEIPKAEGGHGGSDPLLLQQIFSNQAPYDPFGRMASHIDGAASLLIGVAANQSMMTGQPVDVDDLLKLPNGQKNLNYAS